MLIKNSAQYLLGRGLPGIINFLAITLYTRMLSPEDYGRYALAVAGVGLFDVIFFYWIRLSLSRFLPAQQGNSRLLLSTVLASFSIMVLLTGGLGIVLSHIWPDPMLKNIILIAVPLLWTQAWFELNLSLSAIKLLPTRYGLMYGVKSVSALAVGAILVIWGFRAYGPLLGLLVGMMLAVTLFGRADWSGILPEVKQPLFGDILRYGLPLTATFALGFVVSSSDRFLIAWFLGEGSTGVYSAVNDLFQQSLILLMSVVNIAAFPLAVRALEQRGEDAALFQLKKNAILLFIVAIPAAIGMSVLAANVATVMLGPSFSEDAMRLIPWIALATLLSGVRSFHFDLAFQLGRYTMGQIWVVAAAALLNFVLNIWWIPCFGLIGSAYAMFTSYLLALLLSAALGKRVFPIPIPFWDGLKIILASIIMGLILSQIPVHQGFYALLAQVLVGGGIYLILIGFLNVDGYRTTIIKRWIDKRNDNAAGGNNDR